MSIAVLDPAFSLAVNIAFDMSGGWETVLDTEPIQGRFMPQSMNFFKTREELANEETKRRAQMTKEELAREKPSPKEELYVSGDEMLARLEGQKCGGRRAAEAMAAELGKIPKSCQGNILVFPATVLRIRGCRQVTCLIPGVNVRDSYLQWQSLEGTFGRHHRAVILGDPPNLES